MSAGTSASTGEAIHEAADKASPVIEGGGRLGYAAKGVVYVLMGLLALLATLGLGGGITDQRGLLDRIATEPYGTALLVALGIGLVGYGVWRLAMAARNPERKPTMKRIAYAASGIAYGGLGVLAFVTLLGGRGDDSPSKRAAQVLSIPGGWLALVAFGAILVGVAIAQFVNAYHARFMTVLKQWKLSNRESKVICVTGRIGLTARGLVLLVVGGFLILAGLDGNPGHVGGVRGAMRLLASTALGPTLLGLVAVGLMLYGAYMFVEAAYRRMPPVV